MIRAIARGYAEGRFSSEYRRREGVRVFCYHGVVEKRIDAQVERNQHLLSNFREQVAYLKRHRVLGLEGLLDELSGKSRSKTPAAVVTFDDACASTLLAGEILAEHRLPWFLFVPSGEVGAGRALWTVDLSLLLLYGEGGHVDVLGRRRALTSRDQREAAFQAIRFELKSLPAGERDAAMECIRGQFPPGESARLVEKFPGFRMLTWREIEGFANAGVEIGSHGVFHELHHSKQPAGVRLHELTQSKAEIERRTGRPCRSFAYPNGDYVLRSPTEVRESGYDVALTTWPGTVTPTSNPYLLCRLHPPATLSRLVREFWWEATHEVPDKLPKISVEQRAAQLSALREMGKSSVGVALGAPGRNVELHIDFANPPKLARAISILDGLAMTKLREPRIVDLGCGSGWLTSILGCFGPTVGVPLASGLIPPEGRHPLVEMLERGVFDWDYPRGFFDVVVSQQVLEVAPDPARYIEIVHDVLRPGGYLILTTPNARTVEAIPADERGDRPGQNAERLLSPLALVDLLEPRFRIERATTVVPGHGSLGAYRIVNSQRLLQILTAVGLGQAFDRFRCERGYGLHTVVVAQKT